MKKIICIVAVLLLLAGCAPQGGTEPVTIQTDDPSPDAVIEVSDETPTPEVTPAPTPEPTATPSPTPRLYGRLSTLTLNEVVDELITLGADITNVVEYDETSAANSAYGSLEAYTQRVDFTLNGAYDCIAEAFASVDAATARADYYARISTDASIIGCYVYQYDLTVFRIKETAPLADAEAFVQLLLQVNQ